MFNSTLLWDATEYRTCKHVLFAIAYESQFEVADLAGCCSPNEGWRSCFSKPLQLFKNSMQVCPRNIRSLVQTRSMVYCMRIFSILRTDLNCQCLSGRPAQHRRAVFRLYWDWESNRTESSGCRRAAAFWRRGAHLNNSSFKLVLKQPGPTGIEGRILAM